MTDRTRHIFQLYWERKHTESRKLENRGGPELHQRNKPDDPRHHWPLKPNMDTKIQDAEFNSFLLIRS